MRISGWATTSIAKTKHVDAELVSVGKVFDGGTPDGLSLICKDADGKKILIMLSPAEVARVIAFANGGTS